MDYCPCPDYLSIFCLLNWVLGPVEAEHQRLHWVRRHENPQAFRLLASNLLVSEFTSSLSPIY